MDDRLKLTIQVSGPDMDDIDVGNARRSLRSMLLTIDVDDVRPVTQETLPEGAKPGEAFVAGALLVAVAPNVVGRLVDAVLEWRFRQRLQVEVEIGGVKLDFAITGKKRDAIVAMLIDRVKRDAERATESTPGT